MAPGKQSIDVYQLKIALQDVRPPIWRRVLVPATMTLEELHYTIQVAMGWTNSHLHDFTVSEQTYGDLQWDDFGMDVLDESTVRLGEFSPAAGFRFRYVYDFGDGWEHLIQLEKKLTYAAATHYPICVKAKRACPPEDVGGIWGYADFLEALADENHPEHEDMLEWIGEEFDPEAVNVDEINRRLQEIFRGTRWSTRKLKTE